jgi:hypothetical protein
LPPSRLRELRDLPAKFCSMEEPPESVTTLRFHRDGLSSASRTVVFGRESKLAGLVVTGEVYGYRRDRANLQFCCALITQFFSSVHTTELSLVGIVEAT